MYFSSNITNVRKSREIRWAGHVVYIRHTKCIEGISHKTQKGRDHLGDLDICEDNI